jgi:hypothetical protein
VLVCAVRQPLSDDLCYLSERHLNSLAADGLQVPFEALVLLASDHGHIMPGRCRWRRPGETVGISSPGSQGIGLRFQDKRIVDLEAAIPDPGAF